MSFQLTKKNISTDIQLKSIKKLNIQ